MNIIEKILKLAKQLSWEQKQMLLIRLKIEDDEMIPIDMLENFRTNVKILMEALENDPEPDKEISFKKMLAIGSFDPHPGSSFQINTELVIKEEHFIKDGDIVIITEREFEPIPYRTIRAREEQKDE